MAASWATSGTTLPVYVRCSVGEGEFSSWGVPLVGPRGAARTRPAGGDRAAPARRPSMIFDEMLGA